MSANRGTSGSGGVKHKHHSISVQSKTELSEKLDIDVLLQHYCDKCGIDLTDSSKGSPRVLYTIVINVV